MTPEQHCEWHGLYTAADLIRDLKAQIAKMNGSDPLATHRDQVIMQLNAEITHLRHQIDALQDKLDNALGHAGRLREEATTTRAGAAKLMQALDAAVQLTEALIMFLPEGTVLPEGVKTAKGALDQAMRNLRR